MENHYLILCHPDNESFVKKERKLILKEVFEADEGKVSVICHKRVALTAIHTFMNDEYMGYIFLMDEGQTPADFSSNLN